MRKVGTPKVYNPTRPNTVLCRPLLVSGILLLGWIQGDIDRFFVVGDVENLAEGLVTLGDHLDTDLSLGDRRDFDLAFLVGAHFEGGADGLAELDDGVALDEAYDDGGAVNGLAGLGFDDHVEPGHGGGPGCDGEQEEGRQTKSAREGSNTHTFIIGAGVLK